MQCPICLNKTKKPTREHLPFKALYRNLTDEQDVAAVIRICHDCNHEKSIWDQEFLAVYGHLLDMSRAQNSQRSLKNFESLDNGLSVCLIASRAAHSRGESVVKRYNLPCDLLTQWFWMCGRGVYFFFERKPFEGNRVFIIPNLLSHNARESDLFFKDNPGSSNFTKFHKINNSCWIWMVRKGNQSPLVAMSMVDTVTGRMFSVIGNFIENDVQMKCDEDYAKTLKPGFEFISKEKPRDIFNVPLTQGGWSYNGVKKLSVTGE